MTTPKRQWLTDRDMFGDALKTWGIASQVEMMIEECAELVVALQHWKRSRSSDVVSELADVEIMLDQMRLIFGDSKVNDARRAKLNRLEDRLRKAMP
jgi:hypothetical protein